MPNDYGFGNDEYSGELPGDGTNDHNEQLRLEAIERRRMRRVMSAFGNDGCKRSNRSVKNVARSVNEILAEHRRALGESDK